MQPGEQYCLCFKPRKMKGKMNDFLCRLPSIFDGFKKVLHHFLVCSHFPDLSKSGRVTSNMRLKLWRMCLVGKLVKVFTTLENGCLQQPVSYDPKSGDFVSNRLICGWHVVWFCILATYPHMGFLICWFMALLKKIKACQNFFKCFANTTAKIAFFTRRTALSTHVSH